MLCHILSLLGTDVLKGDPLGLLDITDEVIITLCYTQAWFLEIAFVWEVVFRW